MIEILRTMCMFLLATGLFFILIDFRTKFDNSFRFFGVSLCLTCGMAAIDLWASTESVGLSQTLYWQRMLHVIACFVSPFFVHYLMVITKSSNIKLFRTLILVSVIISCLIFTNSMLGIKGNSVSGGILYYTIFFPYILGIITILIKTIVSRFNKVDEHSRRILVFHLFGISFLGFCGLLDMTGLLTSATKVIPSFKVIGILGFGFSGALVFAERFAQLLQDRDTAFSKLQTAYSELEDSNNLKELGKSTAIINHEIKNHLFMISGQSQMLLEMENLSVRGKEITNRIISCVHKLNSFTKEILELSKSRIIKEKHPVNLVSLIQSCIERFFPGKKEHILIETESQEQFIYGDWKKLENVFINLIKNSLEAMGESVTPEIKIHLRSNDSVMLVSIEDNGLGCTQAEMEKLFQAFYTTKTRNEGTGLGLSFTRTIVESHGGKINSYSKNLSSPDEHGMLMVMTFPIYEQESLEIEELKVPIYLAPNSLPNYPTILQTFRNLKITPKLLSDTSDYKKLSEVVGEACILGSSEGLSQIPKFKTQKFRRFLVSSVNNQQYVANLEEATSPQLFCEEYVLTRMLPAKSRQLELHSI